MSCRRTYVLNKAYAPKMADYGLISYFSLSLLIVMLVWLLIYYLSCCCERQDLCKVNRMINGHWLISVLGLRLH